jgi:hypothetical protein
MKPPEKSTAFGELQRAALSFFVLICLFGLAALFFFSGSKLFACLSIVPGMFGLLVLYSGIHSLLAAGTPFTKLTVQPEPLPRGTGIEVTIRQGGPIRFHSLRANLVCERITGKGGDREITYPCQLNFFDSGRCEIARHDTREFAATVTAPHDAPPSREEPLETVAWRIEVWGKVQEGADFMRPFEIEVV